MGCGYRTTDRSMQTKIPHTDFVVTLIGPDSKGHYRYSVSDRSSVLVERFLGPTPINDPSWSDLIDDGSGRYRIAWGKGSGTAYAVIDCKSRSIVEDSNRANPANQPF
jgi:hypothetical protein